MKMTLRELSNSLADFWKSMKALEYSTNTMENTLGMLMMVPREKMDETFETFQELVSVKTPEREFRNKTSRIFGKAMGYE